MNMIKRYAILGLIIFPTITVLFFIGYFLYGTPQYDYGGSLIASLTLGVLSTPFIVGVISDIFKWQTHYYEGNLIEVILFNEMDEVISKVKRKVVPNMGDSIVIDCGWAIEVIVVSHQWHVDDNNFVQIKTKKLDYQSTCDMHYEPLCQYYRGLKKPCAYGVSHNIVCPYVEQEEWFYS